SITPSRLMNSCTWISPISAPPCRCRRCRRRDRREIIDRPERSTVVICADDLGARILQVVRSRFIAVPGRLLAAAVCALVGHVALYQSVLPSDEVHSYLSW